MADRIDQMALPLSKRAKCTTLDVSNAQPIKSTTFAAKPAISNDKGRREAQPHAEKCTNTIPLTGRDHGLKTLEVPWQDARQDAARLVTQESGRQSEVTLLTTQERKDKKDREYKENDGFMEDWYQATRQIAMKINAERSSTRDENKRLQQELKSLEGHLKVMREEVDKMRDGTENQRRIEEELTIQLKDTARQLKDINSKYENLGNDYVHFRKVTSNEKFSLEKQLDTLQKHKDGLESSLQSASKSLAEEKAKTLCQICLKFPKDTICHPCLHLHYCFGCLEKQRQRNNSCPSCRMPITGIVRFDMCIW